MPSASAIKAKIRDRWFPVVESSLKVKSFVGSRARFPRGQKPQNNPWKMIELGSDDWIELFQLQISLVQYVCSICDAEFVHTSAPLSFLIRNFFKGLPQYICASPQVVSSNTICPQ